MYGSNVPVSDVTVSNNIVYNNGKNFANQDGILLNSSPAALNNITVTGNRCYDSQATRTQRYGIYLPLAGTMSNILIANNNLADNKNGGIFRQNTSYSISIDNNIGANPNWQQKLGNISGNINFNRNSASTITATLTGNAVAILPAATSPGQTLTLQL